MLNTLNYLFKNERISIFAVCVKIFMRICNHENYLIFLKYNYIHIFQVMSLSHIHTSELYKDETDWVSSMWETLTVSRDKFNVTKIDLNCMTTGGKNKINIRKSKICKNRNHERQKDINKKR